MAENVALFGWQNLYKIHMTTRNVKIVRSFCVRTIDLVRWNGYDMFIGGVRRSCLTQDVEKYHGN